PLVIALFLSFSHVTDQLYQQSERRLRHESKAVGLAVLRELLSLTSELERVEMGPADVGDALPPSMKPERAQHLRERFRALTLIDRAGVVRPLFGPPLIPAQHGAEQENHLASGKSLLSIREGADRSARLMLEVAVDRNNIAGVIAELETEWLARSVHQALTIPDTAFCLLNSNEIVIVCSAPDGSPPPRALPSGRARAASGAFRWRGDGDEFLASYRSLSLESDFREGSWIVVSSEPSRLALAPLDRFRVIFPLVILLTIAAVTLLSVGQIRRFLVPLEAIMLGTQRISNHEFDVDVSVESGDEFEELASSLNSMSGRLRKRFSTLDRMIEVDRLILSAVEVEGVAAPILERIGDLYPSDFVTLLLKETESAETVSTFYSAPDPGSWTRDEMQAFSEDDIDWLRSRDANSPIVIEAGVPHFLEPLAAAGMVQVIALPLWIDQELAGLLLLGHRVVGTHEPENLAYARQLADQVAVALSNVRRIEENRTLAYYDSLTGLPNRLLFME
ncbi:MAG: HAMP domain-containing protein, partial [Myxococcota bacterium]